MDPLINQTLGKYKIERMLGEGGMGAVYQARHAQLGSIVAIKVMHAQFARQPSFHARFLQEARTAARLDHPGIVKVHDFGQAQSGSYIVMDFIPGDNLQQRIEQLRQQGRWFSLAEALELIRQLALTLDYAHSQGVLHRDIKPANIMLRRDSTGRGDWQPIITDLGLAKLSQGGIETQTNLTLGTPAYMAPEQALGGTPDARSDVYSLGVLLYELAVGRRPLPITSMTEAVRYHHKGEPPPSPRTLRPDLPKSVERVILQAIEKTPAHRFQSAGALAQAIVSINLSDSAQSGLPSLLSELKNRMSKRRALGQWVPLLLLIVMGGLVWGFWHSLVDNRSQQPSLAQVVPTATNTMQAPVTLPNPPTGTSTSQMPTSTPIATLPPTATALPIMAATRTLPPATQAQTAAPATATQTPRATHTLLPTAIPTSNPTPPEVVTKQQVNVRSGPGTAYGVIGSTNQGERFTVTGKNPTGEWWQINFHGQAGWIFGQLVTAQHTEAIQIAQTIPPAPPTQTPIPTATVAIAIPSPTFTLTPASAVGCASEPQGVFHSLWLKYKTLLGCPTQVDPTDGLFAEQPFQQGHMFWSQNAKIVIVTVGNEQGRWYLFDENDYPWHTGMPDTSCVAAPPSGFFQPIHGFGVLWCRDQAIQNQLGWATDIEHGFDARNGGDLVQRFAGGLIFRDSDGNSRGLAYVFLNRDNSFVRARIE